MGVVPPTHYADIMRRKCVLKDALGAEAHGCFRMSVPHRNPIQSFSLHRALHPTLPPIHDGTFVTSSQTFKAIWNFQGSQLLLTNPNAAQHFLQCKSVKLIIYFSIKFDPHPEMGPIWATKKKSLKNFSWLCWLFKRDPCHGLSLIPI